MDTKTILKPLMEFKRALSPEIQVDEMIVFGSYLEGTATDESDIDVIIVSRDFDLMADDNRLDLLYKKSIHIRPVIHPWGFTRSELTAASALTTWGYARKAGIRFA